MIKIPQSYFNYFSIGLLIIYLINIFVFVKKGLLSGVLKIVFNVGALFVAFKCCGLLADKIPLIYRLLGDGYDFLKIAGLTLNQMIDRVLYFIIVFILIKVLFLLINPLLKKASDVPVIGWLNKLGGAIIGILNATLIAVILSLILSLPLFANGAEVKANSLFKYVEVGEKAVVNLVKDTVKNINFGKEDEKPQDEVEIDRNTDFNEKANDIDFNESVDEKDMNDLKNIVDIKKLAEDFNLDEYVKNIDFNSLPDIDLNQLLDNVDLNQIIDNVDLNEIFKNYDLDTIRKLAEQFVK